MNRAIFGVGAVVASVLVFVAAVYVIDAGGKDTIADGVRIGTLDVGGMSRDEASALVRRKLDGSVAEPVPARYDTQRFVLSPERARARLDVAATVQAAIDRSREGSAFGRVLGGDDAKHITVAPRVAFDRGAVETFATNVARRVGRPARDADIDWHDGKIQLTHARKGVQVHRDELVKRLVAALSAPPVRHSVAIPVKVVERPDRTLQDVAKRYPTVIAVDRDSKQLRLYKRLQLEHKYKIAVGKAGLETSAGRYKIEEKIVNPDWHVPNSDWAGDLAGRTIPAGDPQNPLEARYMGFHAGEGIHGTAELGSLGAAASHGCIRMAVPDVKQLFRQVKVGTPVFVQ
jgi:lipoprotein-anchoring transpeptidase ErfK/SrfK